MNFNHTPVLLKQCIENLNIKSDGTYIDATLGGAGHSLEIIKRLDKNGLLIGIDQDINAIETAKNRLNGIVNFKLIHDNFSNIESIAEHLNLKDNSVDGFLMDLGVSSHQLDETQRGFSYMKDAPLDMRMDRRNRLSAFNVVNEYPAQRLKEVIYNYGEERWAKRISEFIVKQREQKPIETTFELVSVIKKAVPKAARADGPHPARRTFQAIRIEVNNELEILKSSITSMLPLLKKGGRICIITFHSLEDRIVKNTFKELENPCTCPVEFPICVCGKKPIVKIVTKKPISPDDEEIALNHRARSAKLRVCEKL